MRVAILGCGYVGIELGRQLQPTHEVIGIRRSPSGLETLREAGIRPIRADITDPVALADIGPVDAVVFAASADGRSADAARETYVTAQRTAIEALCSSADGPDRYLYTSSTGVYGDHGGNWVDESTPPDPESARGEALLTAERIALEVPSEHGVSGSVARLAGLYGPDRYRLDRYLEGPVAPGYLNLVHRTDAAGALAHLLVTDRGRDEVTLVVDNDPVERQAFADWLASECGVPEPPKRGETRSAGRGTASKRCSNEKLRRLGYEFTVPTAREGYQPAIESFERPS